MICSRVVPPFLSQFAVSWAHSVKKFLELFINVIKARVMRTRSFILAYIKTGSETVKVDIRRSTRRHSCGHNSRFYFCSIKQDVDDFGGVQEMQTPLVLQGQCQTNGKWTKKNKNCARVEPKKSMIKSKWKWMRFCFWGENWKQTLISGHCLEYTNWSD